MIKVIKTDVKQTVELGLPERYILDPLREAYIDTNKNVLLIPVIEAHIEDHFLEEICPILTKEGIKDE